MRARLDFAVGDVLDAVPAAASDRDAYLLSAVLHGFDDATCVQALSNVARAAAPCDATIVLLEMIMPERRAGLLAAAFDMQMFMATGGRERTLGDWRRLFALAGVRLVEIVDLVSVGKMLVLKPAAVT